MSDALTPLRHVYGVEPAGPEPAAGERGHAELQMLRQMRAVLDGVPRPRPSAHVIEAVLAHADPLAAVRHVYDGGAAPPPTAELALLRSTAEALTQAARLGAARPETEATDAVLARSAEASTLPAEPALAAGTPVEAAVLAQSLEALDRLPIARPSPAVTARVLAYAEAASAPDALAAVRHVYADGPPADAVEVAALRQSGEAVDRALRARPPRPSAATVAAVLARAAEASALPAQPALGAGTPVEASVLTQSLEALDRLPIERPAPQIVEAIRDRAASAARPARRSPDRTAARPERRRRTGVWAGTGGLLVAALVAVFSYPRGVPPSADKGGPGTMAVVGTEPALAEDAASEPPRLDAEAEPAASAVGGAAAAPGPSIAAATPPARPSPVAAVQGPTVPPAVRQALAASAEPARRETPTPSWDASDDVRMLSLRLQELDRETQGLEWDAPAEALGTPSGVRSPASTPGVQVVREGASPAGRPAGPARADSSREQR